MMNKDEQTRIRNFVRKICKEIDAHLIVSELNMFCGGLNHSTIIFDKSEKTTINLEWSTSIEYNLMIKKLHLNYDYELVFINNSEFMMIKESIGNLFFGSMMLHEDQIELTRKIEHELLRKNHDQQ